MANSQLAWHPFADKFPPITGAEWQTFKASIKATQGPLEPIKYRMVDGRKEGLDGKNRERACREEGLDCPMEEVWVPDGQVKDFILARNVHRRHLTPEFRRAIVAELHADGESGRRIAATLGVSEATVRSDLKAASASGQQGEQNPSGAQNCAPEKPQSRNVPDHAQADTSDNEDPPPVDKPEPEPAKVTGRDGKTYSASKPPAPRPKRGDAWEPPDPRVAFETARKKAMEGFGVLIRAMDDLNIQAVFRKSMESIKQGIMDARLE